MGKKDSGRDLRSCNVTWKETVEGFSRPPARFRPLQIIHGLDRVVAAPMDNAKRGIDETLNKLLEAGLGGVVANVASDEYLESEKQWQLLDYGLKRAVDLGMDIWLYDEKGYPSGTAGGLVLKTDPTYEALGLACYAHRVVGPSEVNLSLPRSCLKFVAAVALPVEAGVPRLPGLRNLSTFLAPTALSWTVPAGEWMICYFAERYMYEGTHASGNVHAFRRYINVMDQAAVRRFIELTHQRYHEKLDPSVWQKIRAVFTDEPSLMAAYIGPLPDRYINQVPIEDTPVFIDRPPAIPWLRDFSTIFLRDKGYDLIPHLVHLYMDFGDDDGKYVRQDYYELVTDLYTEAFFGQIGTWCEEHGIASSGHLLAEESIIAHTPFEGCAFTTMREMHLPGIDMLTSNPEQMLRSSSFMTPKFISSVAHLTGADQVMSETSDWEQRNYGNQASLEQMIGTANLLYALGVNVITSYYAWEEIGDAYSTYCEYVGRLGTLLTGGQHVCEVAMLYPIRSAWAYHLPGSGPTGHEEAPEHIRKLNSVLPNMARLLLTNQIDFDFIDEKSIIEAELIGDKLRVSNETYRVIILPHAETIPSFVLHKLEAFAQNGGLLISLGSTPERGVSREDTGIVSDISKKLFASDGAGVYLRGSETEVIEIVKQHVSPGFALREANDNIIYLHRRRDERDVHFIINNSAKKVSIVGTLASTGPFNLWRPLTGTIEELSTSNDGMNTQLELTLQAYEGVFVVGS